MKQSIFVQLRDSSGIIWKNYVDHPFVRGIGNGSLPKESFRYYLIQDYLFLIQFGRAYALAAYKSDTLTEMRSAAASMLNIIDVEMQLHTEYCQSWGLSLDDLSETHEDLATTAYTRFVIDCGTRGDLLDLMTALAPCVIGYAEIGSHLAQSSLVKNESNPYKNWINMYSGDEYQQVSDTAAEQLNALFMTRGGPGRYDALSYIFNQATKLEIEFWEMAWQKRKNAETPKTPT